MSEDRELIHLHLCLILPVDALVRYQTCSGNHVGSHSVADEENDILGLLLSRERAYHPVGNGFGAIVVVESRHILSWLVESNTSVDLGRHADNGWRMGILREEILVPREVPGLQLWLGYLEE